MPRMPHAPLEQTPAGPLEMTAKTAPTVKSLWHAQQVWFRVATQTWLRLAALPVELAGCGGNLEALLELQRRHIMAGVSETQAFYAELAALSGDPMPGRVGAAGVSSTGI